MIFSVGVALIFISQQAPFDWFLSGLSLGNIKST